MYRPPFINNSLVPVDIGHDTNFRHMAKKTEEAAEAAKPAAAKKPAAKKPAAKKPAAEKAEATAEAKTDSKEETTEKTAPAKKPRARVKKAEPAVETPAEEATVETATEAAPAEEAKVEEAPVVDERPKLEDFDWTKLDKKREVYSDSEREEMERMYDETLTSITEHTVIDGKGGRHDCS